MDFLKPRLHSVPLSGGTVATMTVFDVKALFAAAEEQESHYSSILNFHKLVVKEAPTTTRVVL